MKNVIFFVVLAIAGLCSGDVFAQEEAEIQQAQTAVSRAELLLRSVEKARGLSPDEQVKFIERAMGWTTANTRDYAKAEVPVSRPMPKPATERKPDVKKAETPKPPQPAANPRSIATQDGNKKYKITALKLPTEKGDVRIDGVLYQKGEIAYAVIREDEQGRLFDRYGKPASKPDIEKQLPPGAQLVKN
jgi:hypothetical protein